MDTPPETLPPCRCTCHDGAKIMEFKPCCPQCGEPRAQLRPRLKPPPVHFTKMVLPVIRKREP